MQIEYNTKNKVIVTGIVFFFIFGILLWEHFHEGVASHHILHQKELPAISNWWSGLLLPVLTWILLGRIEIRLRNHSSESQQEIISNIKTLILFIMGLVFAILIAVAFTKEYTFFLDHVIYLLLITSLFIPIYYGEFILGFILGMTYTFGAILPTIFILLLAAVGFLIFRFIRPFIIKLFEVMGMSTTQNPTR